MRRLVDECKAALVFNSAIWPTQRRPSYKIQPSGWPTLLQPSSRVLREGSLTRDDVIVHGLFQTSFAAILSSNPLLLPD